MQKLDEPFRNQEIFIISFFNSSDCSLESKKVFLTVLVDILPLESGYVDPNIFSDPDPRCQNLADPMDPMHCPGRIFFSQKPRYFLFWFLCW